MTKHHNFLHLWPLLHQTLSVLNLTACSLAQKGTLTLGPKSEDFEDIGTRKPAPLQGRPVMT